MSTNQSARSRNLDFSGVSREIMSLVARRRELLIFHASLFAAMGILLQNILEGKVPAALKGLEKVAFLAYAVLLLIPSIIVALRIGKIHGGMIIQGLFYLRIQKEHINPSVDPNQATRLNLFGVSTQFYFLVSILAGGAMTLVGMSIQSSGIISALLGIVLFLFLLVVFWIQHNRSCHIGQQIVQTATIESVDREDYEDHISASLQDVNHDMLATITFVGLILFSVFESVSGLGVIGRGTDLAPSVVKTSGPIVFGWILLLSCLVGAIVYTRLRVSLGWFCFELDPTDRPFRTMKITDSFLGYCMLIFFGTIAVHLLGHAYRQTTDFLVWTLDALTIAFALFGYQSTLHSAERKRRKISQSASIPTNR